MRFRNFLLTEHPTILSESKQSIVGLGFPEFIAKLLYERFGKHAFLMAKWFRGYKYYGGKEEPPKHWWKLLRPGFGETVSLPDLTYLYNATDSPESYRAALEHLGLHIDEGESYDEYYLQEQKQALAQEIKEQLFKDIAFTGYSIVRAIESGEVNPTPYKNLTLMDAQEKYDKKQVFKVKKPLKVYPNGYKWIDVGKKCFMLGNMMRNCGSAGLMSSDPDRTIIALFDAKGMAHVMVTYSPNEGRISGDQGGASTEVKEDYHDYVLDLAEFLKAHFDVDKSKSKALKVKYLLRGKAEDIQKIGGDGLYDSYFRIMIQGREYYSNGDVLVSREDAEKLQNGISQGAITLPSNGTDPIANIFSYRNQDLARGFGVQYIPISQLAA